jgi:predicted transcriptional regulator
MVIGVRMEADLEQKLDQLARSLGKSRSACVREAIALYVNRFGNDEEAQRQSALVASSNKASSWSEQVPDWEDWTA